MRRPISRRQGSDGIQRDLPIISNMEAPTETQQRRYNPPISAWRRGLAAARSPNLQMDVTKLSTDLNESLPMFSPMLERFFALFQEGYPQKVKRLVIGV